MGNKENSVGFFFQLFPGVQLVSNQKGRGESNDD